MSLLSLHKASVTTKGAAILTDVSLSVAIGQMVGLLGPNGAGKTTAARALLGLQTLTSGSATLNGKDAHRLASKDRARIVSYLPQARKMAWPISVRDMVGLGRYSHGDRFGHLTTDDHNAVNAALSDCDLSDLAQRSIATLSGGELARVHLARTFVARAQALVVDEPTNALDPRHAFDSLARLKQRAGEGNGVLVILHDLVAAARYCDQIVLLDKGKVVAGGAPRDVLTTSNLARVYRIAANWEGDALRLIGPSEA
jgi:iron complex transport system ATP-binding protein